MGSDFTLANFYYRYKLYVEGFNSKIMILLYQQNTIDLGMVVFLFL